MSAQARKKISALRVALNGVYEEFLLSPEAQEFAANHPGEKLTVSAAITLQGLKDKGCNLTYRDPGYVLKS